MRMERQAPHLWGSARASSSPALRLSAGPGAAVAAQGSSQPRLQTRQDRTGHGSAPPVGAGGRPESQGSAPHAPLRLQRLQDPAKSWRCPGDPASLARPTPPCPCSQLGTGLVRCWSSACCENGASRHPGDVQQDKGEGELLSILKPRARPSGHPSPWGRAPAAQPPLPVDPVPRAACTWGPRDPHSESQQAPRGPGPALTLVVRRPFFFLPEAHRQPYRQSRQVAQAWQQAGHSSMALGSQCLQGAHG